MTKQTGGIVTGFKDTDSLVAKFMSKTGLRKAKRVSKKSKKTVSKELSKRPKDDFVIVRVDDDDVVVINISKGTGREYKVPFGKTLDADLDDGSLEGRKALKKGVSSDRKSIWVDKQIHQDIPIIYFTAHSTKKQLEKTAIGMNDDQPILDITREEVKISQSGGGRKQRGGKKISRKSITSMASDKLTVGSKRQVYNGTAKHTSGGLKKSHLMMNKRGHIVSKKQHAAGKRAFKRNGLKKKTKVDMAALRKLRG